MKLQGNYRWVVCGLLFFATTINYMDRQILGLLKPMLSKELNWTEADYGNIVACFQFAYGLGQFVFGRFVDIVGTKMGYSVAIVVWSLAAAGHGLAGSVFSFGAWRVALGLGEAGNFPTAIKSVAEWFPKKERALATGIFNSGSNVGAIFAPVLVPWLALSFGWRTSFVVLGAVGIIWLLFWLVLYDVPEKSRYANKDEVSYIQDGAKNGTNGQAIPLKNVIFKKETWALTATGILVGPAWWFYLFWLPPFFDKQFGLNLKMMSLPLVFIYGFTCVGSIGGGWLSSRLLKEGWSVNASRKTATLICAVCTIPVVFATSTTSMWLSASLFALAAAAHQGWAANMYTVTSDIFPQRAIGSVLGLGAAVGTVTSTLFTWGVGQVLERTQSYTPILIFCGSAYVAAWIIFALMVPRIKEVQFDEA